MLYEDYLTCCRIHLFVPQCGALRDHRSVESKQKDGAEGTIMTMTVKWRYQHSSMITNASIVTIAFLQTLLSR